MARKTRFDLRIEPHQVDFTLRATLPSLLSSILNAAGLDAHMKGFGTDAIQQGNRSWVLSRMAVEIDRRPEQYAGYALETWISDYGRLLSTRNFTLTDEAGDCFGRCVTQWAMIDLDTRSAVDLSWVGREHADAVVAEEPPAERPRKIRAVAPGFTVTHPVVYSDIDFHRHVNTIRDVEMMVDALPVEWPSSERPVRIDIHFLRECRYGQTLAVGCQLCEETRTALFEIAADGAPASVRASFCWK